MKDLDNKEIYNEKLNKALIKRALGYTNKEITEEFADDNGNMKLTKKKVIKKNIPPDITAVKVLLELYSTDELNLENLSDEELLLERDKLLEKLRIDDED